MIVCICHRVSDRDIAVHAHVPGADFDALQEDLRVGTSCGACVDCAREVWSGACAGRSCCGADTAPAHRISEAA